MTTLRIDESYLLEQVREAYERGRRDERAAAEAEMMHAAAIQFAVIHEKLAVMGEQLKAIPDHEERLEDRLRELESAKAPDHEARIRVLESAKAKLIGAAAAVSAVVSVIATLIVTHH